VGLGLCLFNRRVEHAVYPAEFDPQTLRKKENEEGRDFPCLDQYQRSLAKFNSG